MSILAAAASSSASQTPLGPPSDHLFHPMIGPRRGINKIIQELSIKYRIGIEVASKDWLIRLRVGRVEKIVYGYDLGLNSSATASICNDKAATSTILSSKKIPNIEHRLFLKPANNTYSKNTNAWKEITKYGELHGFNIVCKPKSGFGGINVSHITSDQELQKTAQELFQSYRDLCLSPFEEVTHEYRVIMLDGKPEIIFQKIRPHLIGDGLTSLHELLFHYTAQSGNLQGFAELAGQLPKDKVLARGEIFNLTWKHNLCQGATSKFIEIPEDGIAAEEPSSTKSQKRVIDEVDPDQLEIPAPKRTRSEGTNYIPRPANSAQNPDQKRAAAAEPTGAPPPSPSKRSKSADSAPSALEIDPNKLIELAKKAAKAVGVVFASVDVAQLKNGSLKIMEINNGVSMENLIQHHGQIGYQKVKQVYEKALCLLVNLELKADAPPRITRSSPSLGPRTSPPSPPSFH